MTTPNDRPIATPITNADLASLVNDLSPLLEAAEARLGPEAPATTSTEKRRRAKPRKGSDRVFALLAPVVKQHKLDSEALNSTQMVARSEAAQTLVPLLVRLEKITKRVSDEVFDAQTDAWEMGLQFYALLQRRAKIDGELAKNMDPLTKVFAYRHPTVKADKLTKVQARVKARLKETLALAERLGVSVEPSPSNESPVKGPA